MEAITAKSATSIGAPAAPVTRKRKWLKYGAIGASALAASLIISHFVWVGSGSNRWELAKDQEGIKVWTLKTPGTALVKVKASTTVQSKVAGMVKLLEDLESCVDAHCYDGKVIESVESVPSRYAAYITFKLDIPGAKTREYVLFQQHHQDAGTKELHIDLMAAPNAVAPDECCVRVKHLHNKWHIVPRPNNLLDVELIQDTDIGGLPYFIANIGLIEGTFEIFRGIQGLMNKEKYRNAHIESIQELTAS